MFSHRSLLEMENRDEKDPNKGMSYYKSKPDEAPMYCRCYGRGHHLKDKRPNVEKRPGALWEIEGAHPGKERYEKKLREHLRRAQFGIVMGLAVLGACVSAAAVAQASIAPGIVHDAVSEGLLIVGWVAIWRPIEALLYDWWPLARDRHARERLLQAKISVRTGRPG